MHNFSQFSNKNSEQRAFLPQIVKAVSVVRLII